VDAETASNDDGNTTTGQRLFTTTTKPSGWPNVVGRRSVTVDPHKLPDDGLQRAAATASSDGPVWRFVSDIPTVTRRTPLNHADAASMHSCRKSPIVDDVSEYKAETEVAQNSAHARCTAVSRFTPDELDDARRSAVPPDVAADIDALATAAAEAFASDGCPYVAVARAAVQAASAAVSDVILQVRDLDSDTIREVVELEVSARCMVRCSRSVKSLFTSIQ